MMRLIACGSIAAEAVAHLSAFAAPVSESAPWLMKTALAVLPLGFLVLRSVSSKLAHAGERFEFDPEFREPAHR
jgi:cation transporter-like permease